MQKLYLLIGSLFWLSLLGLAFFAITSEPRGVGSAAAQLVLPTSTELPLETTQSVPTRTPVLVQHEDASWGVAGWVRQPTGEEAKHVFVSWNGPRPADEYEYYLVRSSRRFEDTLTLLFPAETRQMIRQSLAEFHRNRGNQLLRELRPFFEQAAIESVPVIERGVRESLRRHDDEVKMLTERYRETLMKDKFVPVVREEVIPTVREHAEPLMNEIGRELWDRASLWRFGWRALYDKSPLPDKDLTTREWQRFVDDEVTPVLDAHADDFVAVQQEILADLAANPNIRQALRDTATTLIRDDDLQRLLKTVIKESVVENEALREIWRETWESPGVRRQLEIASAELEPLIREIGDEVFGDRERGINPRFARVLRNQILGKDRIWIEARPRASAADAQPALRLNVVAEPGIYPLVVQANGADEEGSESS